MAKIKKKEATPPLKKKKVKEEPAIESKSKWQEFMNKHAVSKQDP
jgi:hypothetical protein